MDNLEQALSEVENGFTETTESNGTNEAFDIIVKNGQSGMKTSLYVTPANVLGQVLEATASTLGINKETDLIFVNESTAQSATDRSITLRDFKITENSVVSIVPYGKVAAR